MSFNLDKAISVAQRSGKTALGVKKALSAARTGDAKAIVIASNAPNQLRDDVTYYANLSEIPVIEYPKTSQDLGILCGRPHLTAFFTIYKPGDSDIMKIAKK
ncbi:MAG: 50S ribosomal protein L30e [Candidatus Heimdallarchaeota archaeon]|nr:50S ribosomal protein L30e [Candidatus Heimdallarchaeota archaeon]